MKAIDRCHSLDALKTICAFLVICIHYPFKGVTGAYFVSIARIAVPLFFMISGYYYYKNQSDKFAEKQIVKIVKLLILSNLVYCLWNAYTSRRSITIGGYLYDTLINPKNFGKCVFLNESPFACHLWYLSALLYVFLVFALAKKCSLDRYLVYITPILLLTDLILGKYSIVLIGRIFSYFLVRNFLFVGIPYFSLGIILSKYKLPKVHNSFLLLSVIVFVGTTIIERFILEVFGMNAPRDHYMSTTFLAASVFLFAINNPNLAKGHPMAIIGLKYSSNIYIYHIVVNSIISPLCGIMLIRVLYEYYSPLLIFIITVLFVLIFQSIGTLSRSKIVRIYHGMKR